MTPLDLQAALLLLALIVGVSVSYAVRVAVTGRARFARVDAAGGSLLLGKRAMEMGYWGLSPLAKMCVRANISADGITSASLALGAAAGVALALGHLGVGGVLATASALGDVLDGFVARATGRANPRGGLFDAAVDRYGEFFIVGGLALHYHDDQGKLALALLVLLGSFMVSYGSAKAEALGVSPPRGAMRRAERAAYVCGGAVLSPIAGVLATRGELGSWVAEAPVLAALALVGVVSNVSAVRRLGAVGRAATVRAMAPRLSLTPPVAAVASGQDGGSPKPPRESGVIAVARAPRSTAELAPP
jgi:CDP-diacylglycerol---glycerol-3-phosphate 3-phosphatidyltransferase